MAGPGFINSHRNGEGFTKAALWREGSFDFPLFIFSFYVLFLVENCGRKSQKETVHDVCTFSYGISPHSVPPGAINQKVERGYIYGVQCETFEWVAP